MERFSAEANWQLVLREEDGGFTILRAMTPDRGARLPETIFGKPVLALGRHALCHDKPVPAGREVELCCGNPQGEWDNGSLEELTLPESLKKVGDYAFLNCRRLRRLTLADSVQFWGSGALMNCRELRELHLAWDEEAGETLDYFVGELSRELEVQLTTPRGRAHLIFPEYTEIYEENIPAHIFQYTILGAGYPYHHCFQKRRLQLSAYDGLWAGFLATEHEADCALRLAWWRLFEPLDLEEGAAEGYRSYLRSHAGETLDFLQKRRDATGLAQFLRWGKPSEADISQAAAEAREAGDTESLALLLEAGHGGPKKKKDFTL